MLLMWGGINTACANNTKEPTSYATVSRPLLANVYQTDLFHEAHGQDTAIYDMLLFQVALLAFPQLVAHVQR
jgi:hypothetical protein